jgi:hypothetical protein
MLNKPECKVPEFFSDSLPFDYAPMLVSSSIVKHA